MSYIAELWIPIVLSAVLIFAASSVIHMVLKYHNSEYWKLSNEDAVRAAVGPGVAVGVRLAGDDPAIGAGALTAHDAGEIARVAGVVDSIQHFMRQLLGSNDFTFLSWRLLRGFTLLGLVIVCLSTVVTVVAAAFYNLFAEIMGGVVITVVEEDDPR